MERQKPKEEIKPAKEEPVNELPKFSFPIDFEEEYVPPKRQSNVNILDIEREKNKEKNIEVEKPKELYPKKEEVKPKFKASPVISPVYGILDKNYTKEEVKEREENTSSIKRPSKVVDFETVRKKAFGNLTDELKDNIMCENCELFKEAKEEAQEEPKKTTKRKCAKKETAAEETAEEPKAKKPRAKKSTTKEE